MPGARTRRRGAPVTRFSGNIAQAERSGDAAAAPDPEHPVVETLYRDEGPRLLRYFSSRVDRDEAHDLMHETFAGFLGIVARRRRPIARPGAYLQRIARNLLIDRARRRHTRHLATAELAADAGQGIVVPEDALIARELLARYEQAVADMPERTRTIFVLQRADGLTYRQIAERLDTSLWTVEHHMKRAIAHIDRSFEDQ